MSIVVQRPSMQLARPSVAAGFFNWGIGVGREGGVALCFGSLVGGGATAGLAGRLITP